MRPNLFLIGAAKSGTTSLADYLDGHPEAFICDPKEPNFFAFPAHEKPTCVGPLPNDQLYEILLSYSVTDPAAYEGLFAETDAYAVRGDASVRYLYNHSSAARLHAYAPTARIVAILRNPVDRLNSHYHMNVKLGVERESLPRALDLEEQRIAQGWGWDWHYVQVGMYIEQLQRYDELFAPEQIHVLIYEDFVADPQRELRNLFQFLQISADVSIDTSERSNVGRTPKSRRLHNALREDHPLKAVVKKLVPREIRQPLVRWVDAKNQGRVPKIEDKLRKQLTVRFQSNRANLEARLGRSLPW